MKIRVINIKWQPSTRTRLPERMIVELEDDTSEDDMPDQITYALWRATGVRPATYEVEAKR